MDLLSVDIPFQAILHIQQVSLRLLMANNVEYGIKKLAFLELRSFNEIQRNWIERLISNMHNDTKVEWGLGW